MNKTELIKHVPLDSLPLPEYINMSKNFRKEFLDPVKNPELLEQSVIVFKVIMRIVADLRYQTFQKGTHFLGKENQQKLDFWEEEFLMQDNSYIQLNYKIRDFIASGNTKQMSKILQFLMDFKREEYTTFNQKGKPIKTFGGLLHTYYLSDKGAFQLIVSSYWAEKIVHLEAYNGILWRIIESQKDFKKAIFLLRVMEVQPNKGISWDFQSLNRTFDLNYKSAKDLCSKFLRPIKKHLEEKTFEYTENSIKENNTKEFLQKSFNFGINKNNSNVIDCSVFFLKPDERIEEKIYDPLEQKYKLSYYKKRHQLDKAQTELIKEFIKGIIIEGKLTTNPNFELFKTAYEAFKDECKKDKITTDKIIQEEFISKMQKILGFDL